MKSKGYLKSGDVCYPLSHKINTIGREDCDVTIQSQLIDPQHAVIEASEDSEYFVLKDLDSVQGTFVNECRVQNVAVRLAPGDAIKFGFGGPEYEFTLAAAPPQSLQCDSSRNGWQSTKINVDENTQLPSISGSAWAQAVTYSSATPSLGQRPSTVSNLVVNTTNTPRLNINRPLSGGIGSARRSVTPVSAGLGAKGGWICNSARNQTVGTSSVDQSLLQEKEQRILSLQSELTRLLTLEAELLNKDSTIDCLRQQLSACHDNKVNNEQSELRSKLSQFQNEVSNQQQEIATLKGHLHKLHENKALELSENMRNGEVGMLRVELEKVKKDKTITCGLVTQLQRDMISKESSISRLNRDIECLKKEVKDKDVTISAINAKLARFKDNTKAEEEAQSREKEIASLRSKLRVSEQRNTDLLSLNTTLKEEADSAKSSAAKELESQKRSTLEMNKAQTQLADVQRAERMARVDCQEAAKRYERFRNRVMQVAFSTPGVKYPEGEIKDDELLDMLKMVVSERTTFRSQLTDLQDKLKMEQLSNSRVSSGVGRFLKQSKECSLRLAQQGRLAAVLKEQMNVLLAESVEHELQGLKEHLIQEMSAQLTWTEDIEAALERCGVAVKLSSESPAQHISALLRKWTDSFEENKRLRTRIHELDEQKRVDLERQEARLNGEAEARRIDAVEKMRQEMLEKSAAMLEAAQSQADQKFEAARQSNESRLVELAAQLVVAQNALLQRAEEEHEKLAEAREAVKHLAEVQLREADLQRHMEDLILSKEALVAEFAEQKRERESRHSVECAALQEQIRQHSVTINAMGERLNKVNRHNKELQEQVTQLKEENAELRHRPAQREIKTQPLTPKALVEAPSEALATLNKLVTTLRESNAALNAEVKEQKDLVESLRRNLSANAARLSDVRGELTDIQKEELEKGRSWSKSLQKELKECKLQLSKMTELVDKHSSEVQSKDMALLKCKEELAKAKASIKEYLSKVKELEDTLCKEKICAEDLLEAEAAKQQEGRISSELSALGHQCRGERHLQVMAHQKEALAELRLRVKQLESLRPQAPLQDQAVQQIVLLKKELAEMRAKQALAETRALPAPQEPQLSGPLGSRIAAANSELEMERFAHREVLNSLELSEDTYMALLRAMASNLDLESVQGLRSMAHLPRDERERLKLEREAATDLLSQRCKVLKERLTRKEELLLGYERDLARLRQAEELAARKNAQVEELVQEVRGRSEESSLLRESLHQTKDMLNQEKKLNTAIKQKKTFYMRYERPNSAVRAKPHCSTEDVNEREERRRKLHQERKKRHDYELRTLQGELAIREQDLSRATSRLNSLETTLGIRRSTSHT